MTPTPPSPEDDILDLSGLTAPKAKSKASTQESDFEKELEALFAEDLAQTEAAAAAKAPAAPAPAPAAPQDEDALLLQDILGDAAADLPLAAPAATAAEEDVLDLSAFAAQEEVPAAAAQDAEDDVLDLSAFAADGPLDLTPPPDTAGGKEGDIDIEALDSLIADLGDGAQTMAATPEPVLQPADGPLDDIDIHGLDDVLNVPKAAAPAAPAEEAAMDLSLGDLLGESPSEDLAAASEDVLDLTLPDLSEPEPGAVLSALDDTPATADEAGDLAAAALSMVDEDLNMSLPTDMAGEPLPGAVNAEDILGAGELEMAGIMEGFDAHMPEVASEAPLDAGTLLDQVDAEAVLGAAAAAGIAGAAMAASSAPAAEPGSPVILTPQVLDELQRMLAELKHQVLGGSVTVVGMQGQLAEKDQIITAMEARLRAAEAEATALREELSALRGALEEDGRTSTQVKERLALLEDRQAQMDQDMRAEIERAVPREAAKVIREEIAALADSMRD